MPEPRTDRYVWTDLETFGINAALDPILEVGFMITDLDLNPISTFEELCWDGHWYDRLYERQAEADSFVFKMHRDSGLWRDASETGRPMPQIEIELLAWLEENEVGKGDPICGSSLGFDKDMLGMWMPDTREIFSYRVIDVSSVKEICMRVAPKLFSKLDESTAPRKAHRVISDIEDTIGEYLFYLDNFLKGER